MVLGLQKSVSALVQILSIFCIFFISCSSPSMLISSSHNVPLLTKKNETRIEAGTGTQYFGMQASHAFSNHFEAMGTYSYGQTYGPVFFEQDVVSGNTGIRNGGELALGYFSKLDSSIPFELFAGMEKYYRFYGTGGSIFAGTYYRSANINKPFIQADMGIFLNKRLQLRLSCRVGYLIFDHYNSYHVPGIDSGTNNNNSYSQISNLAVFEPAAMLKFGRKRLNLFIQYGLSIPTKYLYSDSQILFFNMGLSYRFPWKKKNDPAKS